jgi:hypothetical protein
MTNNPIAENLAYEYYGIKIGDEVTCVDGFLFGNDPDPLGGGHGYKPGRIIIVTEMSLYHHAKNPNYPDKGQIILWGKIKESGVTCGIFAIATDRANQNSLHRSLMLIKEELT